MPYATNADLPKPVRKRFSDHCQGVWRQVWNETFGKYQDEARAAAYAYTAAHQCQEARSMTDSAVRIVGEDDSHLLIEGPMAFGGPFPGNSDSYGTRATPKTNFYWNLFADRSPDDPPSVAARFVRPVNYQHGFDPAVGLSRVGGFSPMRADKKAIWLQAQLDKHHEYYDELRQMIDQKALAFSPESAEHSVRFSKSGDWEDWPLYTIALTPTPSNPWNEVAARTAQTSKFLVRVTGIRAQKKAAKKKQPPPPGLTDALKQKFLGMLKGDPTSDISAAIRRLSQWAASGHFPKGLNYGDLKWLYERYVDELHRRDPKSTAGGNFPAEGGRSAPPPPDEEAERCASLTAVTGGASGGRSAMRAGKRNSKSDQSLIDSIHDACVALGTTSHMGAANDDRSPDAGRSAGALPIRVYGMERADARKAIRKAVKRAVKRAARDGSKVGAAEVRRLVG